MNQPRIPNLAPEVQNIPPMRFRIDIDREEDRTVLRVSGTLRGPAVDELDRVCRQAERPLAVDLCEVMTVDGFGVVLLRELSAKGARLIGASPYVKLLLETQTA